MSSFMIGTDNQINWGDQMEEDEIRGTCDVCWGK
jgi:hypothetical protein